MCYSIRELLLGRGSNMKYDESQITDDLFVHAPYEEEESEELHASPKRVWKESLQRLVQNGGALIGFVTIIMITILSIFGPVMNKYAFDDQDLLRSNLPPLVHGLEWVGFDGTNSHGKDVYADKSLTDTPAWLGTDEFGRDLWTRVWRGTQVSMIIGL